MAAEQLREIGLPLATALLEPVARNTAPAVTLAALAATAAWQQRSTDTYASATFVRPDKTLFAQVPAESVDCAVLEHGPGSAHPIFMVL